MAKAQKMPLPEDFTHKLLSLKQIRVRSATHGTSLITACGGTSHTTAKSLKKTTQTPVQISAGKILVISGFFKPTKHLALQFRFCPYRHMAEHQSAGHESQKNILGQNLSTGCIFHGKYLVGRCLKDNK